MKVIDHTKFAMCDYNQTVCNNPFELGDIVIHKESKDIGVVIQIHDEQELRVDMFGNECIDNLRLATVEDLNQWENERMRNEIFNSIDLFTITEILPDNVKEVLNTYSLNEIDYNTCEALLKELNQCGYTFEYGLDAVPYELRKIGTTHHVLIRKNKIILK